jgi:hypothetical protein
LPAVAQRHYANELESRSDRTTRKTNFIHKQIFVAQN